MGVRATLSLPMSSNGRPVGILTIQMANEPRDWTPTDIAMAEAIAKEAGGALDHAELFLQEQEAVRKLQEIDSTKSDFVSSISHELRTPLTSIVGYVEMLEDGDAGPLNEDQLQMVDVVSRNSHRLLALIEDLLTLSRIESGSFRASLAPVELGPIIDNCRLALRPQMGERNISFESDLSDDLLPLMADSGQIERVLFNVVTNAVKFSPEDSTVWLSARNVGSYVE